MNNEIRKYLEEILKDNEDQLIKLEEEHKSFENYYREQIATLKKLLKIK